MGHASVSLTFQTGEIKRSNTICHLFSPGRIFIGVVSLLRWVLLPGGRRGKQSIKVYKIDCKLTAGERQRERGGSDFSTVSNVVLTPKLYLLGTELNPVDVLFFQAFFLQFLKLQLTCENYCYT